jgi:hypothetical protein
LLQIEEAVCKSTGGSFDIERNFAGNIDIELFKKPLQLYTPSPHKSSGSSFMIILESDAISVQLYPPSPFDDTTPDISRIAPEPYWEPILFYQ